MPPRAFALLLALALSLAAPAAAAPPPDVIFRNATFATLDTAGTMAQAVAVTKGIFTAVGTDAAITALAGPDTRLVDLGGRFVSPGLIDAHTHPMETYYLANEWVDCRYPGTPSVAEALRRIAAWAARTPKGQWIDVACVSASENKFAEKRLPTKAELDAAAPDNPLVLANGAHQVVINTAAIKALGITKGMTQMPHGATVVLGPDGEPTGVVLDSQADIPTSPSPATLERAYTDGIQELWNANGFTSLLAITPAAALPVLQKTAASGTKPHIRYTVSVWTASNGADMPESLDAFRMPAKADPAWYRFAAIKDWVDGENDARSGYTCEPYRGHSPDDPPGGHGTLVTPQAGADRFAAIAAKNGVIPMFHCSGDAATDIGLSAYERLAASGQPLPPCLRIEHFGMFQIKKAQIDRAVALRSRGLRVSVQPIWLTELVKADFENMDPKLAASGFRFRDLIDAGLEPAASTDMTGIYLGNISPIRAMAACVTRQSDAGLFEPGQAVTPEEALRMWTSWAAASLGESAVKGSIEPGKYADMTVYSGNLLTLPREQLKDVAVMRTIVGGETVYQAP
ncbi:MAG: amidohydrolase [Solidesulfovibrio sp. DCME]|uniref:amidohydrolase n=1 Tax=Solidesulfovibrio sp. DCME TaxID=3447380 RepID=UPI003D0DD35F